MPPLASSNNLNVRNKFAQAPENIQIKRPPTPGPCIFSPSCLNMAPALMDEPQVDIRDDAGKWMELITSVNLPESTAEALSYGFNISSIGTMQASIRRNTTWATSCTPSCSKRADPFWHKQAPPAGN